MSPWSTVATVTKICCHRKELRPHIPIIGNRPPGQTGTHRPRIPRNARHTIPTNRTSQPTYPGQTNSPSKHAHSQQNHHNTFCTVQTPHEENCRATTHMETPTTPPPMVPANHEPQRVDCHGKTLDKRKKQTDKPHQRDRQ